MSSFSKGFANLIIVLLVVAVLAGGVGYIGLSKQNGESNQISESIEIPSGWTRYENKEIGVAFYHPASWGTLGINRETWCALDEDYYGKEGVAEIQRERASSPGDKCDQVSIGPIAAQYPDRVQIKTIFSTLSPLYAKYPTPKGGSWHFYAKFAADESYVRNLCSDRSDPDCTTFTNQHGVFFAKKRQPLAMGDETDGDFVYYVHSPNPLYPGITLSAAALPADQQRDFEQLLGTLSFVP